MTLEEQCNVLESADMLRIVKGNMDLFVGYLAAFTQRIANHKNTIYEEHKDDPVIRFRAVPEVTHRKWEEKSLMPPLQPEETPDYKFEDMQVKLYYTIYI